MVTLRLSRKFAEVSGVPLGPGPWSLLPLTKSYLRSLLPPPDLTTNTSISCPYLTRISHGLPAVHRTIPDLTIALITQLRISLGGTEPWRYGALEALQVPNDLDPIQKFYLPSRKLTRLFLRFRNIAYWLLLWCRLHLLALPTTPEPLPTPTGSCFSLLPPSYQTAVEPFSRT